MIKQLEGLINSSYENVEDMQKALLEAIPAIETAVNNNAEQRKDLGKKADELTSLKELLSEKLSIEDVDVTSINEAIETISKSSNEDIETLKTSLSEKHNTDLEALRSELGAKDSSLAELQTKYNDTLFNNTIVTSGLLDGFVDETMARNNIVGMIKDKLIYEDGKVFVKNESGEKAKDIRTGEYLKPESAVSDIKSTIAPMYLARETTTNGGDTPPPNQTTSTTTTVDTSKHRDVGSFMSEAMSLIK